MTHALYITYRPSPQQLNANKNEMTAALADHINQLEGLISNMWIQNTSEGLREGLYFFDTAPRAEAFKEQLVAQSRRRNTLFFSIVRSG